MTVLERLTDLQMATYDGDACTRDYLNRDEYAGKKLETLLALAEAVKANDQQAMDKAIADLEKEAV